MKKTKIVCTLGPASSTEPVIANMLKAGMNIARFNFSHGTHESHLELINTFRKVRDSMGVPAAVLLDTKGPEIRLKNFENGSAVIEEFVLTTNDIVGTEKSVSITYKPLPPQLKEGDRILIDDGKIGLKVLSTTETDIICTVTNGGKVKDHKSINLPGIAVEMPFLSEADKSDLLFGIENDVDFIAASFVRSKQDVIDMRKFLDYNNGHAIKIISKIENLQGVDNFDEILEVSDGIMVARGDMGVEIDFERLPGLQKKFIRRCYQSGKMVICATQMLESMIENPTPTRAEITDVANAVFDGTSAVMLSGETTVGKDPVRVVETMAQIVGQAEKDAIIMNAYRGISHDMDRFDITNAISDATCTTAKDLGAKAIIAVTMHGTTARSLSKFRPDQPIIAATPLDKTFHQLALSWGVFPVKARMISSSDELFIHAVDCAKQIDMVSNGDRVVIAAGLPLQSSNSANTIKAHIVGERW